MRAQCSSRVTPRCSIHVGGARLMGMTLSAIQAKSLKRVVGKFLVRRLGENGQHVITIF